MKTKTLLFLISIFILGSNPAKAQTDTCINIIKKHTIQSKHVKGAREYWVSLPIFYDSTKNYPVIYVLDGQWRFDLIRPIAFDLAGNKKIPGHIIVGLPHRDWRSQRGIDYTFSNSSIEYDSTSVDSTIYNPTNSGGAEYFYRHLTEEVMPDVDAHYPTNGKNILVGHSYGGYFGTYILPRKSGFTAFQIYDPSIWFSEGEAINQVKEHLNQRKELDVFISYQPVPLYHAMKIEELIEELSKFNNITLYTKRYADETHNSLFMSSFIEGILALYKDWEAEE